MRSTTRSLASRSLAGSSLQRVQLVLSFATMLAAMGCGKTSLLSSGGAKGYGQGTFKLTVQNGQDGNVALRIKGGRVSSDDGSINCGLGASGELLTACSSDFPLGSTVLLRATANGNDTTFTPPKPYLFLGWAGDCTGEGDCTLSTRPDAADKYVVAVFSGERWFHSNYSDPAVHGPAWNAFAAGVPGALDCTACHGANMQGQGIAIGCSGCHPWPYQAPTYSIGGTASGLLGSGLVLQNNARDDLVIASPGTFAFTTKLGTGVGYSVTVANQPSSPPQRCDVLNGAGTVIAADVTNIVVSCRSTFLQIAAGESHYAAVRPDGSLWTWGFNDFGQLGNNTTAQQAVPVQVGTGFASVAAGYYHTVAVKTDGTVWAWGYNGNGQIGDGSTTDRHAPVLIGTGFLSVAAGAYHTVAVKTDGSLWAWGHNLEGQLGMGWGADQPVPLPVANGSGFASVAAGGYHTVALKADGTLWSWGLNGFGQLGSAPYYPWPSSPTQMGIGFASVAAGDAHTVAVKADGTLWAWGYNAFGQIGNGTTTDQYTPVQIGSGVASVAAGGTHTLAVKSDGTLWSWGNNFYNQLGYGTEAQQIAPVQVGSGFASVAAGYYSTVALKMDGTLWQWGDNTSGQPGLGVSGTWHDDATLTSCGYSCYSGVGYVYHFPVTFRYDTATLIHGVYDAFPIHGSVLGNNVQFGWQNVLESLGPSEAQLSGSYSGSTMFLPNDIAWINSFVNGTATDQLVRTGP